MNHTHIEIEPGAIATFRGKPTVEETETLQKVHEHFYAAAQFDALEKFLSDNHKDIQPTERAKIREMAAKAIVDEKRMVDLRVCPEHLRDQLRRLISEAAYQHRCRANKEKFKVGNYMPIQGTTAKNLVKNCKL